MRLAVGRTLRTLRHRAGLSQEGLGERAQVHRTYVGSVERGERNPSTATLARMLQALGVTWAEFGAHLDDELAYTRE